MIVRRIRIEEIERVVLQLGFVGENDHVQIRFDANSIFKNHPEASFSMVAKVENTDVYPIMLFRDENDLVWNVANSHLTVSGEGKYQLTFVDGLEFIKTYIGKTSINESMEVSGDTPTPVETWVEEANRILAEIPETIDNSLAEAKASGEFDGEDGFSPLASVSKTGDTATIVITDKDGTTSATVKDGKDGTDGHSPNVTASKIEATTTIYVDGQPVASIDDGEDGDDGYSPTASVNKVGKVATITITDKDGTTTSTVSDGAKGDTGATPALSIGTVETLDPGDDATVTITGTDETPVLNFGIPQGDPGEVTEAELTAVAESKADIIHDTASGAIATFSDGADNLPVKTLTVEIDPVQDLHGYEYPWPAGGGKNKLPFDLVTMKSLNLGGSWTDNVYLRDGITITVNADGTIKASGQAESNVYFTIYEAQFVADAVSGTYILNGCPSGGSGSTYNMDIEGCSGSDSGSGVTLTYSGTLTKTKTRIRIISGANLGTGIVFKPMIRLATESDATFAPYENLCPISGWTGANVSRTGKNLFDMSFLEFNDSSYTHTFELNSSENARNFVKFLSSMVGQSFITSAVATGTASGSSIGQIRLLNSSVSTLVTINLNTAISVPSIDYSTVSLIIIYGSNTGASVSNLQIELGSTASTYEAYQGSKTEYAFPDSTGTVYGGTLTIHQDGSGELVVDRVKFTEDGSSNINASNNNRFYINHNDARVIDVSNQTTDRSVICDRLASTTWAGLATFNVSCAPVYGKGVAFRNDEITTAQGWKDYFTQNPTQFSYALAEPIVYELTNQQVISLLHGANNVWADTGDVALEYPADTKLYIDGKVAELQALILENISNS